MELNVKEMNIEEEIVGTLQQIEISKWKVVK
jgi:hypothetical protein